MTDRDIPEEYQKWSEAQKEAFLEDEREDARLYIVFFSLFAGFCLIGLHSLIVGTEIYPSEDIDAFLFTFTPYPDLIVILFAVLGILNIFCIISRIQIHDKIVEKQISLEKRFIFYIRTNNAFKTLLTITFLMNISIFIVFALLTHAIALLIVVGITIFVYARWRRMNRKLKSILDE